MYVCRGGSTTGDGIQVADINNDSKVHVKGVCMYVGGSTTGDGLQVADINQPTQRYADC